MFRIKSEDRAALARRRLFPPKPADQRRPNRESLARRAVLRETHTKRLNNAGELLVPNDYKRLVRDLMEISDRTRRGRGAPAATTTLDDVRGAFKRYCEASAQRAVDEEPPCDACSGGGWRQVLDNGGRPVLDRGVQRYVPCECRIRKAETFAPAFEAPSAYADARLSNYVQTRENSHAIAAGRDWLAGQRRHLYFYGLTGRGKTRLACTLANEHPDRAAFIRVPWLIALTQRSIDDPSKRREMTELRDRAERAPVVVLDDLAGGEKNSDHSRGLVTTILDRRWDRDLATIVTSNLPWGGDEGLGAFYNDERIPSRLADMCGEPLEIGGRDYRIAPLRAPKRPDLRIIGREKE
jgi:DNA replication protein DnaC